MNLKLFLRSSILIILLVGLGFFFKTYEVNGIIDKNWIDIYVGNNGLAGCLIFFVVAILLVTVGFPRQIISFLAGYAFGLNYGTTLALGACAIGCSATFFFARFLGREWIHSKFSRRLNSRNNVFFPSKADQFFSANTFITTLLIRFMPVGSNFVTNLVAGVSGVRAISFIGGSTIGYIPQTVIFALLGSGFNVDLEFRIILSIVLFLASILLGFFLYRKYKRLTLD
jgi:uncharacterized membrane protein YdjX (TVP38/TMEM64 family)